MCPLSRRSEWSTSSGSVAHQTGRNGCARQAPMNPLGAIVPFHYPQRLFPRRCALPISAPAQMAYPVAPNLQCGW